MISHLCAQTKAFPFFPAPEAAPSWSRAAALFAALASIAAAPAWSQARPVIGDYPIAQRLNGEVEASLWVSGVTHPNDVEIAYVEARITPPPLADGSDAEGQVFYHIRRLDDLGGGSYEFTYRGFFDPGKYEIRFQAQDVNGVDSDPVFALVIQDAGTLVPDPFEPDNSPADATWIGVNGSRLTHNFHAEGDEDWFWFFAEDFRQKNHLLNELNMQTEDDFLGFGVDTLIQVFRDDGTTLLFEHNDTSNFLQWIVHEVGTGFYFVRVTSVGERAFGPQTNYDMRVWREQGMFFPAALTGFVTDADSGEPIEGANVAFPFYGVTAFGPLATETDANGLYVFTPLIAGTYTVEATAPGFETETYDTTIEFGETVLGNFAMTGLGSEGEGEGEGEGPGCASNAAGPSAAAKLLGDLGLALIAFVLLWAAGRRSTRATA